MCRIQQRRVAGLFGIAVSLVLFPQVTQAEPESFEALKTRYEGTIRPLVARYCIDCHATASPEGELDLQRLTTFASVRRNPAAWRHVVSMLQQGEMPPADAPQPSKDEREVLIAWVTAYLDAEAWASAGDPGPVVLRRLNNAEYTYTVQDLTGIPLKPASEFPVDSAAGEGFTNTGQALVMSPALAEKYLNASKEIASHAVLLPDGFRFSKGTTRRDWSDEILSEIREIYGRYTSGPGDASRLDRWNTNALGITENDGRVDLRPYFEAYEPSTGVSRLDHARLERVAKREGISAKYLKAITMALDANQASIIKHGQFSEIADNHFSILPSGKIQTGADSLARDVRAWQDILWDFQSIGHLGLVRPWQYPVDPLPNALTLRQPLTATRHAIAIDLKLSLFEVLRSGTPPRIRVSNPRVEFADKSSMSLREIARWAHIAPGFVKRETERTATYLTSLDDVYSRRSTEEEVIRRNRLNRHVFASWKDILQLPLERSELSQPLQTKLPQLHGHASLNGWGGNEISAIADASEETIRFLTIVAPPRSVMLHPSPREDVMAAWRSPIEGKVRVELKLNDADNQCGNGVSWRVEKHGEQGRQILAQGTFENGRQAEYTSDEPLTVLEGDTIGVVIVANNNNHSCDTTQVRFTIEQTAGGDQRWDLVHDVVDRMTQGNPLPDAYGHRDVWHFVVAPSPEKLPKNLTEGSVLTEWRSALVQGKDIVERTRLAGRVEGRLLDLQELAELRESSSFEASLLTSHGPLFRSGIQAAVDALPAEFVANPAVASGPTMDLAADVPQEVELTADQSVDIRLPADLVHGGTLVIDVQLENDGAAQASILPGRRPRLRKLTAGVPILVRGDEAKAAVKKGYDEFRELFPAAMCYARVVPIDEGVTLLLYHREDDHLARLMLNDEEKARLDRLWDELHFVSQDRLRIQTALEQLLEFASQDGDPRHFEPVREPIARGAAEFVLQQQASEPLHLHQLMEFASRAYRRPLAMEEEKGLRQLYAKLREDGHEHHAAFRMTLARVLAGPAFLYRLEQPVEGPRPGPVNDWELATRLSYFLTSSLPDEELRRVTADGQLRQPGVLSSQARRLLAGPHAQRLAEQFACQWLHVRDFDQLAEKSEAAFPEFPSLRAAMYKETVLYFTDLFQNDGSILSIIDSDHTFLNNELARHYRIPGVKEQEFRRVDHIRLYSRGGVLTQATILASQSGASRTSPVLRGNWISETLLGERLPRPPKDVPVLPETVPEGSSERELVERHTREAACAKCHARIDPYGFALENFDAIGRYRTEGITGRPIQVHATLIDGTEVNGVNDLRKYLSTTRREAFVRQFCRKLLGYALGRGVQLSDEPLLTRMMTRLAEEDYRFSVAVEEIIASEPFQNIRGRDQMEKNHEPTQP